MTAHSARPAPAAAAPAAPAAPETAHRSKVVDRAVLGGATFLMTAVLAVATGASIKAQNLVSTRPGSDGDMFAIGPISVVLVCVLISLPTVLLAATRFVSLVTTSTPKPLRVGTVLKLTELMAAANAAMSWVSWWAVSQRDMYWPGSITRAQDAIFAAGLMGVLATVAVGFGAALVLLHTRARSTS